MAQDWYGGVSRITGGKIFSSSTQAARDSLSPRSLTFGKGGAGHAPPAGGAAWRYFIEIWAF
jgi:hypothetical protein